MMKDLIDAYFKFRGYDDPNRLQAMWFLLSEVGELVAAYRELHAKDDPVTPDERTALQLAMLAGKLADRIVSSQSAWVRNGGRKDGPDLAGEVADVYMMLDRFALEAGLQNPTGCLLEKMERKGFDPEKALQELVDKDHTGDFEGLSGGGEE